MYRRTVLNFHRSDTDITNDISKEYTPHDGSVPFHPAPASRHTLTALPFKVYPVSHVYETVKRSTDTTADPKSGVTGILQTAMK